MISYTIALGKQMMTKLLPLIFLVLINTTLHATIISYTLSAKNITFYHKDAQGVPYANFQNLKMALQKDKKELIFAMNGGMYLHDLSPQGLYIEKGKVIQKVNRRQKAYGNFYMQPNGIFCITQNAKAYVKPTKDFLNNKDIIFATQSGPMLLINGKYHPKFMPHSKNLHIRNGVGVLPNGDLLFAISKEKINFYNFATFFKKQGCQNALYLDGFVSRIYLPKQNIMQYDSIYGIIIANVKDAKKH